ncbi:MAG: amino acid permease, partial [Chloroflexota bacterium]|nr:amino acid permease [Chloroflexota bacterium]
MQSDKGSNTELDMRELRRGSHPGDRYARVTHDFRFRRVGRDHLSVTPRAEEPTTAWGRLQRVLIGSPIESAREVHERLTKVKALAVFGSDNISSTAYATEEIMRILLLGGLAAVATWTLPLTIAVIVVLVIVVTSYQQTIRAYPKGASAYIVASSELGRLPGLTAAASLLNDYVLTVSVSIAAGVAALGSLAVVFYQHRVLTGVLLITLMAVGNLRGIRESGSIFSAPTYIYILSLLGLLGYGLYAYLANSLPTYTQPAEWIDEWQSEGGQVLGLLLILRAFASGSVGLSGTEAISDGVPAFKAPEDRNARVTLIWMASTFGVLFLGISFLASRLHIIPDPHEAETLLSQLTRTLVGTGPYYLLVQIATALVLVLA